MEYVYIAMFLQEIGKEISESNIKKVYKALDKEVEEEKLQILIPALSILSATSNKNANKKPVNSWNENMFFQQFAGLQKKFEDLGNSISKIDERTEFEKELNQVHENNDIEKRYKSIERLKPVDCIKPNVDLNTKPQIKPIEIIKPVEEVKKEETEKLIDSEPVIVIDSTEKEEVAKLEESNVNKHSLPARYVYGVADKGVRETLGAIGLDGAEVYTIPYNDICAVVHDCPTEPYQSDDDSVVKDWLFAQQEVLDAVDNRFGVALPMSFDMIIEGKNEQEPEDTVIGWLKENYESFLNKIDKVRNRQEYGVQVIMNTETISNILMEKDEKLKKKKEDIDKKPQGLAYMEKEILKELLKEKIEEKADQFFKEYYAIVRNCCDDIVIEKCKKVGGNEQMLMNLSCLVCKDKVKKLGEELEKIEAEEGLLVRFSGPWAPYSFVTPEKGG